MGGTDEKWHVEGGNDQIVWGMVDQLPPGTARTGQRLVALRDNGDRTLTCSFDADGVTTDVVADHVVLAIPFNLLKQVDLARANLSKLKMRAIDTLTLGNNVDAHTDRSGTEGQDPREFHAKVTSPLTFTRQRRCTLVDDLRVI